VKKFDKFLKETKGEKEFASGSFDMANTEGQLRKREERKINKRLSNLVNKTKGNTVNIGGAEVSEKDIRDASKTKNVGKFADSKGNVVNKDVKQSIPRRTKPITVGALDKRDAAIDKLDKVTIEPQKGDVKKTKNLIKNLEKSITKPKPR